MRIISLLSDFGYKDPYVAEMKAVILSIAAGATIVDISHEIEKFNIPMGAFILASTTPYFPSKAVHVAVVDPGVGTKRRPIIIETKRSLYVGPDNGLLILAAQKEEIKNVYSLENRNLMLTAISKTFHGRDIFAPAAAHLAKGMTPSDFGPAIKDYIFPDFAKVQTKNGELRGEIIYIDDFGNTISNISVDDLKKAGFHQGCSILIELGSKTLSIPYRSAYGEVPINSSLALIGGSNFLEVAINQGNASKILNLKVGDPFHVSKTIFL